jgi:hypothetical protein
MYGIGRRSRRTPRNEVPAIRQVEPDPVHQQDTDIDTTESSGTWRAVARDFDRAHFAGREQ